MNKQINRIPSALKHGCYSGLDVLPTEDRTAFDKLQRDLFDEYQPVGRSEEIIIADLARLMWRKENLGTYRLAELVERRRSSIYSKMSPPTPMWTAPLLRSVPEVRETRSPEELRVLRKEADEEAKRELGPALELIETGDVATVDYLETELSRRERLDGMIVRCLKQLVLVRGVKSISRAPSVETSASRVKRIA